MRRENNSAVDEVMSESNVNVGVVRCDMSVKRRWLGNNRGVNKQSRRNVNARWAWQTKTHDEAVDSILWWWIDSKFGQRIFFEQERWNDTHLFYFIIRWQTLWKLTIVEFNLIPREMMILWWFVEDNINLDSLKIEWWRVMERRMTETRNRTLDDFSTFWLDCWIMAID